MLGLRTWAKAMARAKSNIQFAAIPEFAGIATEVSQEFSAAYAGQQTVAEALAKARLLRLSLADVDSAEGVSQVQAVVEELGTGGTPHQDVMGHLRELLHERRITVGASM